MLLQVENNLDRQPSTLVGYLSTNGTVGGTVVPVKNINGFTNQWAMQLGRTGEEQAEILRISGVPSGTALNTDGTARFAHPIDTPAYQIHYDKVVFLRSTTGTTGAAVAIATVNITPDSFYTQYDDASGVATYAYQSQYYNSVSGDLSGTSPWFLPGGPTFFSRQKLRDRIKSNLANANYIKDDETIHDWITEWSEEMVGVALKVNEAYSLGTAAYGFGTAGSGTITAPLFKYASKIEVTYDGITYTPTTEIRLNQFSDNDIFTTIAPRHVWTGDTTFKVLPAGTGGTVRMSLGQIYTPMTVDSDELPQFLKGYTRGCIEYCLSRAKELDQKDDAAEKDYQKHLLIKKDFLGEITPRDQTGVKYIDFAEGLSGMSEDVMLSTDWIV